MQGNLEPAFCRSDSASSGYFVQAGSHGVGLACSALHNVLRAQLRRGRCQNFILSCGHVLFQCRENPLTFCFSVHLLLGIWVTATVWPLGIVLLATFMDQFHVNTAFSFPEWRPPTGVTGLSS